MFKNYFKIAWRNLINNKADSAINIIGLSIGMAACLLILEFVSFELSYDRFNKNANEIYRVTNDRFQKGKRVQHGTITYSAVGPSMKSDFPEVLNNTRVEPIGSQILTDNTKKYEVKDAFAVDNEFLSVFSYPLIAGNPKTALKEPNNIILSETQARKIFTVRDNDFPSLLGKTLQISRDSLPYKITGICKDVSENSHLQFDLLISYITLYEQKYPWKEAEYDWTDSDFWHYLQLKPGTDYKKLQAKFDAFSKRHFQGDKISGSDEKFLLQPLLKTHLYSDYEYEIGKTGSSTAVWGMLIIATLIIVIAWVNYINLTTARSMNRAKEVGIRKVSGATRPQLIRQFLTESLLMNFISLGIALGLIFLVQKSFNQLVERDLSLSYLFSQSVTGLDIKTIVISCLVLGILISGFYPAFVLSSFKPILVLKGKYSQSGKGVFLRKLLVTTQFAATVALIIGSFVVYKQIRFVNNQDLGMNLSKVLIVKPPQLTDFDSSFISHENSFKAELIQNPGIIMACTSNRVAGDEMARVFNVHRTDKNTDAQLTMRNMGVDYNFLNLYDIPLLAGRNFTPLDYNREFKNLHNILISETAAKSLGYTSNQDAIGKTIMMWNKSWDIIGVIKDFHQKSLHYAMEPVLFLPFYGSGNPISVKLKTKDLGSTIEFIKAKYNAFFPGNLFDYYFIDDHFNALYNNDLLFGKIFALFAGFAIFIACLGLLGLSLFTTAQRTKEIGVRKVLGASVPNIVFLLSKDFIKLIIISFLIASPVAWMVMHNWLEGFAYRIPISWWIFPCAGLLAFFIAIGTVSFQTVKAAGMNPVTSLRSE
ncbi:MAG TPA: ABC transporter permease [Puia sp.]|nr:ABC transporter permease [Puia sp.]